MESCIQPLSKYCQERTFVISILIATALISCSIAAAESYPMLQQTEEAHAISSAPLNVGIGTMQAIYQPNPVYPQGAIAGHLQGPVVLVIVISLQGDVSKIVSVDGPPLLAASARDAVQQWKFKPYLQNEHPIEVKTVVAVYYNLDQPANPMTTSSTDLIPRKVGGGVSPPLLLYAVDPKFSPQAKDKKVGGTVLVGLVVDEKGKPLYIHVIRGVGMGLDENAVEAVKQYKFKPAMENGKPVRVSINIEVNFVLK
jgi:TonB family protein